MTQAVVTSTDDNSSQIDWVSELQALSYAYGTPEVVGRVKQSPEHFIVTEIMDIEPSGEGEHYWIDITKTRLNTDAVAKSLARFSRVANRDIGYSGMKDFHAITRQWFSVWRPKGAALDWSEYSFTGVEIHRVVKHNRKIKRGTHKANHFRIRVVGLTDLPNAQELIGTRLVRILNSGVPNYFGNQRFGRGANNLPQALAMFAGQKRIKDRNLRGILLSSARSWLFNAVISARIDAGTWASLYAGELANLDGSNSVFAVVNPELENERLQKMDIHPTAPLWGERDNRKENPSFTGETSSELELLEDLAMSSYAVFKSGLENARLEYQRRSIRLVPRELQWRFDQGDLCLSFELSRGQFATSVLRELIREEF